MDGLNDTIVPDSEARGLLAMLPAAFRPYASLARFDRPIGWWLLFWPGAWAVALAGGAIERWDLILWLLIGSIALRGQGRSEARRVGKEGVKTCVARWWADLRKNNIINTTS